MSRFRLWLWRTLVRLDSQRYRVSPARDSHGRPVLFVLLRCEGDAAEPLDFYSVENPPQSDHCARAGCPLRQTTAASRGKER